MEIEVRGVQDERLQELPTCTSLPVNEGIIITGDLLICEESTGRIQRSDPRASASVSHTGGCHTVTTYSITHARQAVGH